ncbi:MAG: hypothetical protein IPM82_13430 [Saprospiraceae bacterium]|nr:hypothetical protein [Saprospiraceae bacterium]
MRGTLIAARLGIDRATWFFHANDKSPSSLYTRSGLVGSSKTGFAKKKTFLALQSLVEKLGSKYFHSVVREDETAWVYRFGDADGKVTHLVAWRPIETDGFPARPVPIQLPMKAKAAWLLDGKDTEVTLGKNQKELTLPGSGAVVVVVL